jgi:hypothetical protein
MYSQFLTNFTTSDRRYPSPALSTILTMCINAFPAPFLDHGGNASSQTPRIIQETSISEQQSCIVCNKEHQVRLRPRQMYAPMSVFNRKTKGEGEKKGQEKLDTEGHVRRPCDRDPAEPRIDIRSPKKEGETSDGYRRLYRGGNTPIWSTLRA